MPRSLVLVLQGRRKRRPSWWPKDDGGWVTINLDGGWTAGFDRASAFGATSGSDLRSFIRSFEASQDRKWEFRVAILVDAEAAARMLART